MLKISILCVGKVKEKFYRDALDEYLKRLSRYAKVEIVEVADEKTPEDASPVEEEKIRDKEGARLLEKIKEDAYVIELAIKGKPLTSEQLAEKIASLSVNGCSHIAFVIGGSLGLSEAVSKRADYSLSFSSMTFPHQLMRVILTEQIYRSFRIIHKEPYHK